MLIIYDKSPISIRCVDVLHQEKRLLPPKSPKGNDEHVAGRGEAERIKKCHSFS